MADQILSQEEIDALLSSMDNGEIDLEGKEKREPEIKTYDLSSQNLMLREQFYALEEVYDKFSSLMSKHLFTSLQKPIEVAFLSTEMVKFDEFLQAFSNPTSYNIFTMEPLSGSAIFAIESGLVFSLIDCMFGGDGKPFNKVKEFTIIEQRMMRKFAIELLKNMEEAWRVVYPVTLKLKKTESKQEFVHLLSPNDLVIVVVFSLAGEEFSGNIHLCISYLMLEPIKDKLSSRYLADPDLHNEWRLLLQELIKETKVKVKAELGSTKAHCVQDIYNMQKGDILMLNNGPQDPIVVKIEQISKYLGMPGIIKGSRAVQISSINIDDIKH